MRRYMLIAVFECIDEIPIVPTFSSETTAKGKGLEDSAVCGSQRFKVMSNLPITETQKS